MSEHHSAQVESDPVYQPQDAIGGAIRGSVLTGAAGLFLASVQNTVSKENLGAFGVFTKFGRTVGIFAFAGGMFQFTRTASGNLREKDDYVNAAIGGAFAGALIGASKRSMTALLGNSFALGAASGVVDFTRATVFGAPDNLDKERESYKEEAKTRYRRPINETINELGEGRGIYGPGYEERRKQRIKENYGIEIQEPYWKQS